MLYPSTGVRPALTETSSRRFCAVLPLLTSLAFFVHLNLLTAFFWSENHQIRFSGFCFLPVTRHNFVPVSGICYNSVNPYRHCRPELYHLNILQFFVFTNLHLYVFNGPILYSELILHETPAGAFYNNFGLGPLLNILSSEVNTMFSEKNQCLPVKAVRHHNQVVCPERNLRKSFSFFTSWFFNQFLFSQVI